MRIDPIIPIWLMLILCVGMAFLKRRKRSAYIRQIAAIILIFLINLRIMVPSSNVETSVRKLDTYVLFVVDDTISMLAQDYAGDTERLTAVKKDCEHIVDEMDGAKFAVITFNNSANLISPYSDDSNFAKSVLDSIYPLDSLYARGSSMNVCIDVMTDTLKRAKGKNDGNVVVFFISDGEITNDDRLKSFDGAKKYIDGGAVLGYGTKEGGNMYVKSYYDDRKELLEDTSDYPYKPAVSKIDEDNLKKIADDLGVDYINMNDGSALDKIVEKSRGTAESTDKGKTIGYVDIYYLFAALFAGLVVYEFFDMRKKVIK